MTPEQQLEAFGIAAVAIDGHVHVLDAAPGRPDNVRATMDPHQAQRFAAQFAAAYVQAAGGYHRSWNRVIKIGAGR